MYKRLLLFILVSLFLIENGYAQYQATFDTHSYVVKWLPGTSCNDKSIFEAEWNSDIICEMNFGNSSYAWVIYRRDYINGSPYANINGVLDHINITGGAIGSLPDPIIDGTSVDFYSNQTSMQLSQNQGCHSNFDLTMAFGPHPVSLFNLDTGVKLPFSNSNCAELDFTGNVTCLQNTQHCSQSGISITEDCDDDNGHGTHGLGIQQSIFNKSLNEFSSVNTVDLYSYRVFDSNGVGNLGAILCALSDVIKNPSPRKIVNCSFSYKGITNFTPSAYTINPLNEAFIALANRRIFSVVAAGNDSQELSGNTLLYPLAYFSETSAQNVHMAGSTIAIGAADCDALPATYSNSSPTEVDVSTIGTLLGPGLSTDCVFYEGTSQATFASSAVAAMLLTNQDVIDLDELKCAMISSAEVFVEFEHSNVGSGILRASVAYDKIINGCELSENCEPIHRVSGAISTGSFRSTGITISDGQIKTNQIVEFTAEKSIVLEPGFLVTPSVQFSAIIEDCH